MPKPCILLLAAALLHSTCTFACGNEYYTTGEIPMEAGRLNARYLLHESGDMERPYWWPDFGDNIYERRIELFTLITGREHEIADIGSWALIEQALERHADYKLLSDFAWYELRVGSKRNAVRLLERLYAQHPDEYNIVANLGTAYEVTGRNQQALVLLKKAVAINPASHHGSEWIHVNILEQKLKAKPDYSRITGLKADADYASWLTGKAYDKPIIPDSLMVQLAYQLHERISFIRPQDPVVGRLILDFADLVAIARSRQEANEFYQKAVSYDSTLETATLQRRATKPGEQKTGKTTVTTAAQTTSSGYTWLYITIGALALILLIRLVIQRKKA